MFLLSAVMTVGKRYALSFVLLLTISNSLQAQLQASFSADKTSGCSPLVVNFTSTTSGVSSGATYFWDFGNGNTSSLQNPAAIFIIEQSYTVTLTVTQGTQTSTRTMNLEVYKKPTVDFSSNMVQGCLPLNVGFSVNAQPGSGTLASYHWDFGDGFTGQQFSPSVNHVYNTKQPATVSLTVKNNHGCHATVVKKDLIKVLGPISADFEADQRVLCLVSDPVQFTNKSKGPGTLSYAWDFGDGQTSTQTNPSTAFNKKGSYTVKLTVNSSEGCSATKIQTDFLNVANYTTDMQVPSLVCRNANVTFTALCSPQPNRIEWEVDGNSVGYGGINYSPYFTTPGTHTIKLTATYGNCKQTVTRNFVVEDLPSAAPFTAEPKTACGAPTLVEFKDTTKSAVRWEWTFDYYYWNQAVDATTEQTAFTYNTNGSHLIRLRRFNAAGCSTEHMKPVYIERPFVNIERGGSNPYGNFVSCGPATLDFKAYTPEKIVKYNWTFDNTVTSTEANPSHTFTALGPHTVRLDYETDKGCKGTVYYSARIEIASIPKSDFTTLSGNVTCGNTPVTFQNTGTSQNNYWYINGVYVGSSYYGNLVHQFSEKGKHTIQMVSDNNGCRDTATKVDYIEVLPPFPKISKVQNSCEVRDEVVFSQASRYVEKLHWDFGDGQTASLNADQPNITHKYAAAGKYKIVLTVTNGQCSVRDSTFAYVQMKPAPALAASKTQVCPNEPLDFVISNLPAGVYDYAWVHYFFQKIEYSDGTPFTGTNNSFNGFVHPLPYNGQLSNFDPSKSGLRIILWEAYFGCLDTTNYIPLVIAGTKAGFRILNNDICFDQTVRFEDTTRVTGGNSIQQWEWDFGDGQKLISQQGGIVTHVYANPGNYHVSLRVKDASGCFSGSTQSTYQASHFVRVNGPKAAFNASRTVVPFNSPVFFNNTTNDYQYYRSNYQWDFDDGNTSTLRSPQHSFTTPGKYLVKLTATDPVTGCTSVATQEITVQLVNAYFNFTKSLIGQTNCLPLLTSFTVTAVNVDSLSWDFGDGTVAGDLRFASHVYEKPGRYTVTLTARGANGIIYRYLDSVIITAPTVAVSADDWDGCPGHTVNLNLSVNGSKNYIWDFGDGVTLSSQGGSISHAYSRPGTYTPTLLLTDSNGCTFNAGVTNKAIIYQNPQITVGPATGTACLGQPLQLTATGAQTYSWSPGTGLSDPQSAQPLASPVQTTTYRIDGVDARGCRNYTDYTLTVRQPFTIQLPPQEEICEGKSVTLKASGAYRYQWINTTAGLDNLQTGSPIASPSRTTAYTVVGFDQYGCFTDTAEVTVVVNPRPTVNAGIDTDAQPGDPVQLSASGSSDVVRWTWSPASYLSCTDCQSPVSKPQSQITYKVTGSTLKGCEASDEILIKMQCGEQRVRIPNAFSPNVDGTNDRFEVKGISLIKHMVIYNRWGNKVFERNNFIASDPASCWDGTFKGIAQPVGTYVYTVELQCPTGEMFIKKGTVTLVR